MWGGLSPAMTLVPDDESLKLDDLQRQAMLQQIAAFAQANPDAQAQSGYAKLADAVTCQEVPPALIPRLTAILEISLGGDRIRRTAGAGAHLALMALFQKTPRGQALAAEVRSINAALSQLKGHPLTEISATQRGPGIYSLTIATPACRMVLRFESDGVSIESLDVGAE
jgi:hypothetical protein